MFRHRFQRRDPAAARGCGALCVPCGIVECTLAVGAALHSTLWLYSDCGQIGFASLAFTTGCDPYPGSLPPLLSAGGHFVPDQWPRIRVMDGSVVGMALGAYPGDGLVLGPGRLCSPALMPGVRTLVP